MINGCSISAIFSWAAKYSEPRFTKDLDVFITTDQDYANGVYAALKEFGAPHRS